MAGCSEDTAEVVSFCCMRGMGILFICGKFLRSTVFLVNASLIDEVRLHFIALSIINEM